MPFIYRKFVKVSEFASCDVTAMFLGAAKLLNFLIFVTGLCALLFCYAYVISKSSNLVHLINYIDKFNSFYYYAKVL